MAAAALSRHTQQQQQQQLQQEQQHSNTAAGHQEERVQQAVDHRGARLSGAATGPVSDLMQVLGDGRSSCGRPRVTTTASPPHNQSLTKYHNHQENTQGLVRMVCQKILKYHWQKKVCMGQPERDVLIPVLRNTVI